MNKRFIEFLKKYLAHNDEALLWIMSYIAYCHSIDDCVDKPKDDEFLLKTFEFAAVIYSSHFYWQNIHILYPLVKMAGNSYMDSLHYEKSSENWHKKIGDIIRSDANNVVLAVVEIINGIDARRQASLELREIAYWSHHNLKTGEPE